MRNILNKERILILHERSGRALGAAMLQCGHPMDAFLLELRRRAARWRVEHTRVAPAALALNLQRSRIVAPVVAALNVALVLWLGLALALRTLNDQVFELTLALLLTHLAMALIFGGLGWAAHALRHSGHTLASKALPPGMAVLALTFSVGFVALNQPVFPGITTFWMGCMLVAALLYWPPGISAATYLAAYAWFFQALGWTQTNPELLHAARLNGLAAVAMGWVLSLLLWRNFTNLQTYQEQLESANAELQARQKDLQRLTRLDGLTGLYNRSTFVELTRQELARAQRQGSATSILLLDLDLFKHVNDTWGHPAGDAVLKNVAAVANNSVRSTDLVGRLGGEEFIILLPNTTMDAARKLAEKLRANLQRSPTPWEHGRINSTVSIGVASTTAAENRDFDHLYTYADKALYTAKEKGRNRVE